MSELKGKLVTITKSYWSRVNLIAINRVVPEQFLIKEHLWAVVHNGFQLLPASVHLTTP